MNTALINGLLAQLPELSIGPIMIILAVIAVPLVALMVMAQRYKRCPSNRILVTYGKVGGERAARATHGGGAFVWPIIQDYAYMSLEPITIDIELTSALSKKNIRVGVPSTFTIAISTEPDVMNNAAERLLGLDDKAIASQARDIILGQMRLVIAMLTIEEINQDREKFLDLVNKNVNFELSKVGLYMINVNIRDITDESGYIDALGKKAAAEAINQAKIDTANADREGAIGTAGADREREVRVSEQQAKAAMGQKQAERDQRITVASLEAEGIAGEANSSREQEIAVATENARSLEGKKQAESEQRIKIAGLEAEAVEGENQGQATIAASRATLAEREADARRRGDVALANAARDVLLAEKEQELARMEKEVIAREQIERQQVEISAEAEAERRRRVARGEADAVLARYRAEAEGTREVLQAKADGYRQLMEACGSRTDLAPSLLIIEKLPELVAEQVKAISNLKIDKITVWDGGSNGGSGQPGEGGSTARFMRGLIGSLPPIHELAGQAGIDLPAYLGGVEESEEAVQKRIKSADANIRSKKKSVRIGKGTSTQPAPVGDIPDDTKQAKPPAGKPLTKND